MYVSIVRVSLKVSFKCFKRPTANRGRQIAAQLPLYFIYLNRSISDVFFLGIVVDNGLTFIIINYL